MCFCRLCGLTVQFRLLVLSYSRQDQLRGICVHFYAINSLNLNQLTRLCKNTERENSSPAPAYHMTYIHNHIQVFASCNQINQLAIRVQDLLKIWLYYIKLGACLQASSCFRMISLYVFLFIFLHHCESLEHTLRGCLQHPPGLLWCLQP